MAQMSPGNTPVTPSLAALLTAGLAVASSVSATPTRIGQFAIVGTVAYIAVGTSAPTDWKQIT